MHVDVTDDGRIAGMVRRSPRRRNTAVRAGCSPAGRAAGSMPRGLEAPQRMPPHPGMFLESRFLNPLNLTQAEFAQRLGVSRRRVNELLRGRRGITLDTAVRLAKFFGNDAEFWLQLQLAWDVYMARKKLRGMPRST
jgi:addiction module HigA family antidote